MMQSPENSKAAFWSCPTTQIFSQLPTHTPQHNDLASPPLRRLHFSTTLSPFIIAFGAINPAHSPSVIKTDAAVCCHSQVSCPWDISHSPPARGPFAAATLPSKRHKPATSGMQKQQHFPCKSPLAARQEGLEITPPRCSCLPCLRTLHSWKICSVHVSAADPGTAPGRQQDLQCAACPGVTGWVPAPTRLLQRPGAGPGAAELGPCTQGQRSSPCSHFPARSSACMLQKMTA